MADTPVEWPTNPFKGFLESMAGDAWRSSIVRQTVQFWEAQRRLLDEYETFSRALIERRRTATEATLETMRKLTACQNSADFAQCCGEWLAGSVERMAADSRDILQEGAKVLSDLSQSMSTGMAEAAETATASAAAAAAREAASARGAAIAETAAAMQEAAARAGRAPLRLKRTDEEARP